MTPEMNCGNIETDHVKPISSFGIPAEEQSKVALFWINTQC